MTPLHWSGRIALAISFALFSQPSVSANTSSVDNVIEAKIRLDTYYGDRGQLDAAADLLRQALALNPRDANAYVQAARLTIKGGHIVLREFRPGTIEAYSELIDKALEFDPNNQTAHLLKAEVFDIQKLYAQEKVELEKAEALGTADPWLWIGYGRHAMNTKDYTLADYYYTMVKQKGAGNSAEQRNAYIKALGELARFEAPPSGVAIVKELGRLVKQERDPRDAWALSNFSQTFIRFGMYDEAIDFSREALSIRSYGAARFTLAAALYGKSARLINSGKRKDADSLILEARRYGFGRAEIINLLSAGAPEVVQILPTLEKIVQ